MKNNELFGKLDTNNIEDIELMEKQLEEKYRQKAEKNKVLPCNSTKKTAV